MLAQLNRMLKMSVLMVRTNLIILFAVRISVFAHVFAVQKGIAGFALEAPHVKLNKNE